MMSVAREEMSFSLPPNKTGVGEHNSRQHKPRFPL